jgi:hypothetical protein
MSKLTQADVQELCSRVRQHWPELDSYDRRVAIHALNRIQSLAEDLGVDAVTPESIAGTREILEDYFIPFVAAHLAAEQHGGPSAQ